VAGVRIMVMIEPSVGLRTERAAALVHGEHLDTHGTGRYCCAEGCDTLLSRYNPNPVCSAHGGWRTPRRRRESSP
jgi:hypothetical protein